MARRLVFGTVSGLADVVDLHIFMGFAGITRRQHDGVEMVVLEAQQHVRKQRNIFGGLGQCIGPVGKPG